MVSMLQHAPPSSPDLIGRSSTPRIVGSISTALEYWIPAFAGMTTYRFGN